MPVRDKQSAPFSTHSKVATTVLVLFVMSFILFNMSYFSSPLAEDNTPFTERIKKKLNGEELRVFEEILKQPPPSCSGPSDATVNYRKGELPTIKPSMSNVTIQYKTIHVIYGLWGDGKPLKMKYLDVWKTTHPDWPMTIHNKTDSENLVATEFAWLKPLYDKAPNIQRADLLRLLFVYHYGGLYIDTDVTCSGQLAVSLAKSGFDPVRHQLVGFIETVIPTDRTMGQDWILRNGVTEINTRVANYIFYAPPKSPALYSIILNVANRLQRWQIMSNEQQNTVKKEQGEDYVTIYTTGPDAFTEAVFGGPGTTLQNGVMIMPWSESFKFRNGNEGSWRGGQSEKPRQ